MDRKPAAAMESRESYSMKLRPSERALVQETARHRGLPHTTFARECLLTGLRMALVEDQLKGSTRVTA